MLDETVVFDSSIWCEMLDLSGLRLTQQDVASVICFLDLQRGECSDPSLVCLLVLRFILVGGVIQILCTSARIKDGPENTHFALGR